MVSNIFFYFHHCPIGDNPNLTHFFNWVGLLIKKIFIVIYDGIILKKGLPSLKTNTSPENNPSQKEIHLPTIHFQVQAVSFREGNPILREGNHPFEIVPFQVLLLMEEILHQLRLVVYPIIYDGFL